MTDRSGVGREGFPHPHCLAAVPHCDSYCQTAKVRGASRVSPKSLTVNTITARHRRAAQGRASACGAAAPLLRPRRAWRSSLTRQLGMRARCLATICQFLPYARAGGIRAGRAPSRSGASAHTAARSRSNRNDRDRSGRFEAPRRRPLSPDGEGLVSTARCAPNLSDSVNTTGRVVRTKPLEQTVAILT